MDQFSQEQIDIKEQFIAERGYWRPWTETILRINPQFLKRYASYAGYPARSGPLSRRMVELIYIALDASATHLYENGVRTHLTLAHEAGATPADVLDVLHLVSAQGLESVYAATEILAEEAGVELAPKLPPELRARADSIFPSEARFVAMLAQMDPGYLEVLIDFLDYGDPVEGLSPSERLLVEIALNACFTGYNAKALRRLIRVALDAGIAHAEILQAIQLGAHLSVHGTALGATMLDQFLTSQTQDSRQAEKQKSG